MHNFIPVIECVADYLSKTYSSDELTYLASRGKMGDLTFSNVTNPYPYIICNCFGSVCGQFSPDIEKKYCNINPPNPNPPNPNPNPPNPNPNPPTPKSSKSSYTVPLIVGSVIIIIIIAIIAYFLLRRRPKPYL